MNRVPSAPRTEGILRRSLALAAALSPLVAPVMPAAAAAPPQASPPACPSALSQQPVPADPSAPGAAVEDQAPPAAGSHADSHADSQASGHVDPNSPATGAEDYRQRLRPTPFGWARLDHWCVWVEPGAEGGPGELWDQRWLAAIEQALSRWQAVLPITRVEDPEAAQVRVLRRRPPLRREASGRTRASHGRALLEVVQVNRGGLWRLEPQVQVLISPGQRPQAIEATALHELGHAFGLWGHSDDAADVMAAVPGARPVLELSPRDRATLRWLYRQPTRFGQPLPEGPAESP